MKYNFDEIIDRQGTNALGLEGFRAYLFNEDDPLDFPCEEHELIMMWVADMAFATAPEIINATKKRLDHGIFGYSKVFDTGYKNAFIKWTKARYGYEFQKDHIVISPGVIPALFDLIGYLCKPGEKVLVMTPSYALFKYAAESNSVEMITSDLIFKDGQYAMDFQDIKEKVKDEKVKLCILCNPHNPTGRLWTATELRQFGEICFENDLMVISDEIHCDLLRKGKIFTPLQKVFPNSDRIITCMSVSKTFNLAGFLIANIIIPNEALRAEWNQKHFVLITNPLSIVAAKAAYMDGGNWLNELRDYLDENFRFLNNYLEEHLPQAKFSIPESTYLAWINLAAYFPKEENLTLFFANNAGVLLEGGNMFVDNGEGYIRLNLACPRARLELGLRKITSAIRNLTILL